MKHDSSKDKEIDDSDDIAEDEIEQHDTLTRERDSAAEPTHEEMDWAMELLPDGMRDYAAKARDYAYREIETNPGKALAIAFGAGALAATFIAGTKSGRKAVRKMVKALPKPIRKALPV